MAAVAGTVILPVLRPVVILYAALMVLNVFVGLFSWIYVLTGGGPGFASTTLDFDIYQHALVYGEFGAQLQSPCIYVQLSSSSRC